MGADQKSEKNTEKRKHPRVNGETLVRFEGENFSIYSRALNVSDKGAFVATHYLLEPGTEIAIHLIEANGTESATNARVVRTNTHRSEQGDTVIGFGVEFLQL